MTTETMAESLLAMERLAKTTEPTKAAKVVMETLLQLALEQKEKALKTLKAAERAEKAVKEFLSRND